MYQVIIYKGKKVKAVSSKQAAKSLSCGLSTIRKYLKNEFLAGTLIFDKKINRFRQFIFAESIENFTPPKLGRAKGSLDKTTDRTKRRKAAQINGRLGGIANRGKTKRFKNLS